MNKVIDRLIDMLPLLFFNDKIPVYLMPIFIILPLMINKFIDVITKWRVNYICDIYEISCNDDEDKNNKIYTYITYILQKHNLLQNLKHVECNKYEYDKTKMINPGKYICPRYETNPILIPTTGTKIVFKFNDITIDITSKSVEGKDTKTKTFYRLSSPDYSNIDKFIKYIKKMEYEYIDKINSKDSAYNYYDSPKRKWIDIPINVNKSFDTLFLNSRVKRLLMIATHNFISNNKVYEQLGIPHKLGFLLYGSPGNGKSSVTYVLAKTYNKSIFKIDLAVQKLDFLNQIRNIEQGSIVLFEDIDTCPLSHNRLNSDNEKKHKNGALQLGDILEILDGYCFLNDCIIIMTTNHIDKLDNALIRSGRMDHKIEFTNATHEQIHQIIKYYYQRDINVSMLKNLDISVSELINTIIIPNLNNYNYVFNFLTSTEK